MRMIEDGDIFYLRNPYYKMHRRYSVIVGIWPYDNGDWWQSVRHRVTFFLITFLIVGQIPPFFTMEYTIETIAESFFLFGPTICIATIYYLINITNANHGKEILDHIKNDWYNLNTTEEFAIIKEYAEESRIYLQVISFVCMVPIVINILSSIISSTIDLSLINDKTRTEIYPFQFELFIISTDEHLYFRLFICSILLVPLGIVGMINMGVSHLMVHHACAMFRIVGIIFENAFDEERLYLSKYNEESITATLHRAINSHNRVIEFVESLNVLCDLSYTINIVFGIIIIITDIITMLQFDLDKTNLLKFLTTFFHMVSMTSIAFIQSHVGQKLTEHCADLFQQIITKPWYLLPPRLQKLSILIMMRSMKKCSLTIAKILIVSYELFSKGLQMALSYAMIFHSLQK